MTDFSQLTPAQKRVQVAKDVLVQLDAGTLHATRGVYVFDPSGTIDASSNTVPEIDLWAKNPCEVCAVGSAFLACIRTGAITLAQDANPNNVYPNDMGLALVASGAFTHDDLAEMEDVFEDFDQAWGDLGRDADYRLRRIMSYFIENNGEFDPGTEADPSMKLFNPGGA